MSEGVQIWGLGSRTFARVLAVFYDKEDGGENMTDLKGGYDLIVSRIGTGTATQYNISARKNSEDVPIELLDKLPDLASIPIYFTYDELSEILEVGVGRSGGRCLLRHQPRATPRANYPLSYWWGGPGRGARLGFGTPRLLGLLENRSR